MAGDPAEDLILLAVITGAHGIKGEVKLKSFTSDPQGLKHYRPLVTAQGKQLTISTLRPQKDDFIASLAGVIDRTQAEVLRGTELFAPRSALPVLEEGQAYACDLIGMTVMLDDGTQLGIVTDFPNYGAGDLLDVERENAPPILIPYAKAYVVAEDAQRRTLTVALPEGYLKDQPSPD